MKLKSRPEDFEVEELTDFRLGDGPFAVYLLTKRSLGTPEAMTSILERWNLARRQLSYGGLKDKHAVTRQWVTIHRGPRRNLEQTNLSLIYQGQAPREFTPHDIRENRFSLMIRNLASQLVPGVLAAAKEVARFGIPNYFDDQRFGSLGYSAEFIAKPWCLGDYERALWLALAEDNPHDRPPDRADKDLLRSLWGRWDELKERLPKSSRRSIVTFLCDHPTDFRRAVGLLRQDLRSLYLAAFQSYLWNQVLDETLRQRIASERQFEVALEGGRAAFYRGLSDEELAALQPIQLPLPSARLHLEEDDPLRPLYETVVARSGLELRELRVKYPRDSFFSKGERAAVVMTKGLQVDSLPDELNPGRMAVHLRFQLPRGAYATIVVKRITTPGTSDVT